MDAAQFGGDYGAQDSEEQGHGETEQSTDEGGEEDAKGDGVPAGRAKGWHGCQWLRYRGNSTRMAKIREMGPRYAITFDDPAGLTTGARISLTEVESLCNLASHTDC